MKCFSKVPKPSHHHRRLNAMGAMAIGNFGLAGMAVLQRARAAV